jgi:hypothetical protein
MMGAPVRRRVLTYLDKAGFEAAPPLDRGIFLDCYDCGALAGEPCTGHRKQCMARGDVCRFVETVAGFWKEPAAPRPRPDDVIEADSPPVTEASSADLADFIDNANREAMRALVRIMLNLPEFASVEGLVR